MARKSAFEILERISQTRISRDIVRRGKYASFDLKESDEFHMYYKALMDKHAEPVDDLGKRLKQEMDKRKGVITEEQEEEAREYFLFDFDKSTRWAGRLIRNYNPDCRKRRDYLERAARMIIRAQDDLDVLGELCSPAEYRPFSEEGNPLPELKAKLHYTSNYPSAHDRLRLLSQKIFNAEQTEKYEEAARRKAKMDEIVLKAVLGALNS